MFKDRLTKYGFSGAIIFLFCFESSKQHNTELQMFDFFQILIASRVELYWKHRDHRLTLPDPSFGHRFQLFTSVTFYNSARSWSSSSFLTTNPLFIYALQANKVDVMFFAGKTLCVTNLLMPR